MSDITADNPLQSALLASLLGGQSGGLDLQSLLAAQAGGGQAGGLDLQNLLAVQAGGGQMAELDLQSLLAAQTGGGEPGDDRLNIALRWLEQRRAAAAQSAPVEETPDEAEIEAQRLEGLRRERERHEQQREQARELRKVLKTMYAELETLRTRNDSLAAALGACYLCFGEDIACPECGGQGGPGSLLPDPAAFRQYVAPAVNRVREAQQRKPGVAAPRAGKDYPS